MQVRRKIYVFFLLNFLLLINLSAQNFTCPTYTRDTYPFNKKNYRQFQKQVEMPLEKSSKKLVSGCLTFIESIYGIEPSTNHYVLTWTNKLSGMPLVSLQINNDSIYFYSIDKICLYNKIEKKIIYVKQVKQNEYMNLFNNFFISFYAHWLQTGGTPLEIGKNRKRNHILAATYIIANISDMEEQVKRNRFPGRHSFILNKSTNILQQYSYEPANPQEVGYSRKLYQVIDYNDIINMDFPNEVFQLFNLQTNNFFK